MTVANAGLKTKVRKNKSGSCPTELINNKTITVGTMKEAESLLSSRGNMWGRHVVKEGGRIHLSEEVPLNLRSAG